MQPHMTEEELGLFTSILRASKSYLEFGMGGSTLLAMKLVDGPVYAVESDENWVKKVSENLEPRGHETVLFHADIGPTGPWSRPQKPHGEVNYRNYHEAIWEKVRDPLDLYLIDGRFRVACLCQVLLRARPDSILAIHDYQNRSHYHVVEELVRPIATAGSLSAFVRRPGITESQIKAILERYALNFR